MDEHPGQGLRRVSASSFHPDILRGFARRRAFWYFETAQVIEPGLTCSGPLAYQRRYRVSEIEVLESVLGGT
jgi:hypothetical protein